MGMRWLSLSSLSFWPKSETRCARAEGSAAGYGINIERAGSTQTVLGPEQGRDGVNDDQPHIAALGQQERDAMAHHMPQGVQRPRMLHIDARPNILQHMSGMHKAVKGYKRCQAKIHDPYPLPGRADKPRASEIAAGTLE